MSLNPYRIIYDFPMLTLRNIVYLDNASTTHKPKQVIDAIRIFYENHYAIPYRAIYSISQEATELYDKARKVIADFIGAKANEIVFTRNATEALNIIALSLTFSELEKDDEIITTTMEHHSNILPWIKTSKLKGVKVRFIDINKNGELNYDELRNTLNRKTRIVALTHASHVLGVINDIKRIIDEAHDFNAKVVIDGAISTPHMPVNVSELNCDFLAFTGHKMLGPAGIGVLYGREELLEKLNPVIVGGEMVSNVSIKGRFTVSWNRIPWKFEAGSPNIPNVLGLMEAINYLKKIGMNNVLSYERQLLKTFIDGVSNLKNINIYGVNDLNRRIGIAAFNIDGMDPHDVALLLDQNNIMVRSGYHCAQPLHESLNLKGSVRVSFYIYNTKEDIEKLINTINQITI
ncbi:MAG: cysteine desulfurase [Candidatus Methanomethylicia archaeon]